MEKNKIVKHLTKGLIFSLCCVLTISCITIPTHALDDDGYSLTGISIDIWGTGLTTAVANGSTVDYYPTVVELGHPLLDTLEDPPTFSPQNTNIFELQNLTVGRAPVVRIPLDTNTNYTYDITVTHFKTVWDGNNRINQETETVLTLTDAVFGFVSIDCAIRDGISIRLTPRLNNTLSSPRGDLVVEINVVDEVRQTTTPPPVDDDDEYDNSFVALLFRPVQAMHSAVIFDLNGTEQGGQITIGAIFVAMLGVYGLTAFLKHFAGG